MGKSHNTAIILLLFLVQIIYAYAIASDVAKAKELWRNPNYLKRFPKTRYIHINVYKARNTAALDAREPTYMRDVVVESMKSYAWHNIKIIVDSFETTAFQEKTKTLFYMARDFYKFLETSRVTHGYYMLFIYQNFADGGSIGGHTWYDTNHILGVGLVQISKKEKLDRLTDHITFSHELGHILGSDHVPIGSSNCIDLKDGCIMMENYYAGNLGYPPAFSVKGFENIKNHLERHHKNDFLIANINYYTFQVCGNGMVDPGEECDCGFEPNCILNGENDCCDMNTCKFKNGAQCSKGECCSSCKFNKGGACSESNECHMHFTCSGTSAYCPTPNKKPDGTPCRSGSAYCVDGKCPDSSQQCTIEQVKKDIWYENGCSRLIDAQNTLDLTPTAERTVQSYCGLLPCFSPNKSRLIGRYYPSTKLKGYCVSPDTKNPRNFLGFTPNGHKCGQNKMCMNNKCINAEQNRQSCENIICPDGIVCNMGKCQSKHKDFTECKNMMCSNDKYCNKNGQCSNYIIPEITSNANKPILRKNVGTNNKVTPTPPLDRIPTTKVTPTPPLDRIPTTKVTPTPPLDRIPTTKVTPTPPLDKIPTNKVTPTPPLNDIFTPPTQISSEIGNQVQIKNLTKKLVVILVFSVYGILIIAWAIYIWAISEN